MQRAMLNRATMRVANTADVSGRVAADSIKHELYANKQSSLGSLRIFGFCKMCSLLAAFLILPALAYAQNNLGRPHGVYTFNITGLIPLEPGAVPLPVAAVTRITYTTNAAGTAGSTVGVASYSVNTSPIATIFLNVPVTGTFTVQADGSLLETYFQQGPPNQILHFLSYPSPDANSIVILETDTGTVASGVGTRGQNQQNQQ